MNSRYKNAISEAVRSLNFGVLSPNKKIYVQPLEREHPLGQYAGTVVAKDKRQHSCDDFA